MTATADRTQVQYTHLEKLYGYLPGLAESLPAIFGLEPEEYARLRHEFDETARAAAVDLLDDPELAAQVRALPFASGARILAVGDSITDDAQSWAEILRHLLDLARPDDEIAVVNAGLSAHTTAMVLRRWPSLLQPVPHWVVCGLGGNDVTRVADGKPQVSREESIANLRELRRIAAGAGVANWAWLTPVPVDEERVAAFGPFRYGRSSWRNDDIVGLADEIRELPDPVVDLVTAFGVPADPLLQGADGVHPTIEGQQAIMRALVGRLTRSARRTTDTTMHRGGSR